MSQQDLKQLYREYIDVMWNHHDTSLNTARKYFTEDTMDHDAPPGQGSGIMGLVATFSMMQNAFSDWHVETEVQVQEGDMLVARIRTQGTHNGTFFGIPATGRTFHSTGIHILRYEDGKIAEHWGNSDDLGMMNQLGALVMQGH